MYTLPKTQEQRDMLLEERAWERESEMAHVAIAPPSPAHAETETGDADHGVTAGVLRALRRLAPRLRR